MVQLENSALLRKLQHLLRVVSRKLRLRLECLVAFQRFSAVEDRKSERNPPKSAHSRCRQTKQYDAI